MSDTQIQSWDRSGPLSQLPSPAGIQENYRFFATDTNQGHVLVIDPYTKRRSWHVLGSMSGSLPFFVGPPGSGAPFQTFAPAIAAAQAAGINTVMFLSGRYAAEPVINLPAGMSLEACGTDEFVAIIVSDIVTNAPFAVTPSVQALHGFTLEGTLTCGPLAGPATNAIVALIDVHFAPAAGPGVRTLNDGWAIETVEADIDASAGSRAVDANGAVTIEAVRSNFKSPDRPSVEFGNGGSAIFKDCGFRGSPVRISNVPATLNFINTSFDLTGTPSTVVQGFAGSTVSIRGTFVQQGMAAAGTILDVGTLNIGMGVNLGELQFPSRPTGGSIFPGVAAYFTGMAAGGPGLTTEAPVYFGAGTWRRVSDDSAAV